MATYYAKKALEILREEGPVELYKKFKRFVMWRLRKQSEKQSEKSRYCWYYLQYRGSTPNYKKVVKIKPRDIEHTFALKYAWAPLDKDLVKLKKERPHLDSEFQKYRGKYTILNGSWDELKVPMRDCYHVKGLIEHFCNGKNWDRTSEYTWFKKLNRSEEWITRHFNKSEQLYESINTNGFDSNYPVKVCIGREGEIIRDHAFHRITISKILGLDRIPAKVTVRHKQWQELRHEIHNNGLPEGREDLRDHPDLQDILD